MLLLQGLERKLNWIQKTQNFFKLLEELAMFYGLNKFVKTYYQKDYFIELY